MFPQSSFPPPLESRSASRRSALRLVASIAVLCASGVGVAAQAQTAWPSAKAITLIVPFSPGGSVDFTARLLAQKLGERLKQNVASLVWRKPSGPRPMATPLYWVPTVPLRSHVLSTPVPCATTRSRILHPSHSSRRLRW